MNNYNEIIRVLREAREDLAVIQQAYPVRPTDSADLYASIGEALVEAERSVKRVFSTPSMHANDNAMPGMAYAFMQHTSCSDYVRQGRCPYDYIVSALAGVIADYDDATADFVGELRAAGSDEKKRNLAEFLTGIRERLNDLHWLYGHADPAELKHVAPAMGRSSKGGTGVEPGRKAVMQHQRPGLWVFSR